MRHATATPAVTALAPWFGAARLIAKHVGEELAGGRDQANQEKPEVLVINGPSYAEREKGRLFD